MQEIKRLEIPAKGVRSLCWQGDELVDWVSGGNRYSLDGTSSRAYVNYGYRFDRAAVSPDGQYAVIYEGLGTKGLLLKNGEILREINRSYYHADVYGYPIVLFNLPDRRTVLAHCPEEYNRLEIEDVETGKCLTKRSGETADFFQSRLSVSPDGRYLMSAGWIWHPFEYVLVFDVEQVLARPELLDAEPDWSLTGSRAEIHSVAFVDAETALFDSTDSYYADDDEDEKDKNKFTLRPDQLGHYSFREKRYLTIAPLGEPLGTMMPCGDFVVGFYKHPKLVKIATGEIVARWPDLETENHYGSIDTGLSKMPPLALDPANKRFAVADAEKITVIQLG